MRRGKPPDTAPQEGTTSQRQQADDDQITRLRSALAAQTARADELAAAASLVMGQAAEGCPVVLARGFSFAASAAGSGALLRDKSLDMFR